MMMARGKLVLDENLWQLLPALRQMNFHIITPEPGTKDFWMVQNLLPNRIFVTNNTKDFLRYAPTYEIGIISVEGLEFIDKEEGPDNQTVRTISEALIKFNCWSRSKNSGFLLELKASGKHAFKLLKI
jgi:hypothetical protein